MAGIFLGAAFAYCFWLPWKTALLEDDMWWMLPTLAASVEGKSFTEVLVYLLGPWPISFGQPMLKSYLFTVTKVFGASAQPLIAAILLFHGVSVILLYGVCRLLGLSRRVAFMAAAIHAVAFAHFHVFFFPSHFRHAFAMFTILGLLQCYLRAQRRMPAASPARPAAYWATLGMGVLASFQRSTMIAPVIVLAHLLAAPAGAQERLFRYRRWIPLFAVWMLYPALMIAFVGDVIVNDAVVGLAYPPVLKWMALLALGAAALAGIDFLIRWVGVGSWRAKRLTLVGGFGGLALWVLLAWQDKRQLLLPYHALVPFVTSLVSLLDPLSAALRIDSTQAYQYFPAQLPVWSLLFSGVGFLVFWTAYLKRKPQLWIWVVWYGVCLIHLLRHYSNTPPTVPSRYFVYVTPVLAVVLSCAVCRGFAWMNSSLRVGRVSLEGFQAVFLVAVALPNLMAVPVAQWRGKMANTYLTYDDFRTARLIRDDLEVSDAFSRLAPKEIEVRGVVPMPHRELAPDHSTADPGRYDNFRLAVGQAFQGTRVPAVRVNESAAAAAGRPLYTIEGPRVLDGRGRSINPFDQRMNAGFKRLGTGDREGALQAFRQALQTRPVLLRYLLGNLKLSDLRWLTRGEGLRDWAHQVSDHYPYPRMGGPVPKLERTRMIMEEEIWDQITGLFFVSYLLEKEGRTEEARRWMAQIYFLEPDAVVLTSQLARHPEIQGRPELLSHLDRFREGGYFQEPIPWRKDDYGFERFLVELLLGWRVPSGWERGPALAL